MKKFDCLLRTDGDGGICCSVSIVRSDKEGREDALPLRPSSSSDMTGENLCPFKSSSSLEAGRYCSSLTVWGFRKELPLGLCCMARGGRRLAAGAVIRCLEGVDADN